MARALHYWARIADYYKLDLTIVSDEVDARFAFMSLDWDGKIRMDPSSPYAMQGSSAEGSLRCRVRVRHGSRPSRHRREERRAPALESLPLCDDRLPVPQSAELVRVRRGRQDGCQQPDDRSRREAPGTPALRSARRLQVVRRRARVRRARLRRRRERGRIVQPSRWRRVDDGQGRPGAGAAGPSK